MFQGRFEHTIDDKGRMAIPSAFRRRLVDEAGEGTVMLTIWDQCLAAFPLPEWEQKLATLSKMNQLNPKVTVLKRIFVGCAHECPIDKAGRILLPPELRRDAQLDRDCVVLGQLEKFEIWSAERWARTFNQLADQVGGVFAALAESGVEI